jgi:hypothetical protein
VNITFTLAVLHFQIGTFDIRVDIDQPIAITQPAIDRGVKRVSRWWTRHMAS